MVNIAQIGQFLTIEDIAELRNSTEIGDTIEFRTDRYSKDKELKKQMITQVKGKVVKKYPYIFELDTGETYSWVDYLIGKK